MTKLLVAFAVFIACGLGFISAQAYTHTGLKYDHTCLTHNSEAVGRALDHWAEKTVILNCGFSDNPDIVLVTQDPWPYPSYVGGAAGAFEVAPGGIMVQCGILVPPKNAANMGILVHEVGHCIGLGHTDIDGQSMGPYCCHPIGEDDALGVMALYGAKYEEPVSNPLYQLRLPQVSRD